MSDSPISTPQLSQATIDYNKSLLTPEFEAANPGYARLIRDSLDTALKASGQDKPPPADTRSDPQQFHDPRWGVRPASLPTHLTNLLEVGEPDNAKAVLEATGRDYVATVTSAQAALIHGGSKADAKTLSPAALLALHAY